jgi:D-isomer specific 2-hydroxyacid dehydrogenase, catalytic domain
MVRVLIAEPLAEAGVALLRAHYEVDARAAMTRAELLGEVAGADALVVRSVTRVDAEVLQAGSRSAGPASASTTSTWPRPPAWGCWWSTRPSPT